MTQRVKVPVLQAWQLSSIPSAHIKVDSDSQVHSRLSICTYVPECVYPHTHLKIKNSRLIISFKFTFLMTLIFLLKGGEKRGNKKA